MKKRLLLVEDHPIHEDLIRVSLEERGYEVEALRTYERAQEVMEAFEPHALVLDNKIKDNTSAGLAFLAENKDLLAKRGIGVVFISAYMFEGAKIFETLRESPVETLSKPLDIDELVLAIQQVLKRSADQKRRT